ncbi:MAG TPA: GGDEF domain-containing protein, partial [Candidatus Limnocylindria bacterium]
PPRAFGDRRVLYFSFLAQPVLFVLLAFTGGLPSEYFPFGLLLVSTTVFAPRGRHTIFVAAATAATLVLVALVTPEGDLAAGIASVGTRILELGAFALIATVFGRTLRESRAAVAARADELNVLRAEADDRALTDTLTGLYNRRYAGDALGRLIADARRGRIFSVAAFDLDGFKRLNDTRGHAAGDAVLVDFARVLRDGLRGADIPLRTGGDEFVVLLPNTGLEQAIVVSERLRDAVRAARWGMPEAPVTVSTGVVEWAEGQSAAELLEAADRCLYRAKHARSA